MLSKLRATAEARIPRMFAYSCLVFDRLAARNPDSEVNLLPLFVAPGDRACDVGANRGLFTYWLLRNGVTVTAFEPNPHMVEVLRRRFSGSLARGALRIVESAASNAPGTATLHIPEGFSPLATLEHDLAAAGAPLEDVEVKLTRLDDTVSGDVAFIKVDVEGHEMKVLGGATRILAASRPTILVEAEERHRAGAVASLRALLEPMGMRGFFRDGQAIVPIARFDVARHQRRDALNAEGTRVLPGRTYVNNFIFAGRPQVIARLEALNAQSPISPVN